MSGPPTQAATFRGVNIEAQRRANAQAPRIPDLGRRVRELFKPYRGRLAITAILVVAGAGIAVIPPLIVQRVFDDALFPTDGGGVDLGAHGQRIAAVDEDRRAIGQHDGEPGRAAEAGEPCQALRAAGHVLALVLVGTWHDEAVEATLLQLRTQSSQARRRRGRGDHRRIDVPLERPMARSENQDEDAHQRHARDCSVLHG